MIMQEQVNTLIGRDVYDRDGDKIGTVGQVWADAAGMPSWASVKTGLFGANESLVPLQDADLQADRLVVPFEKSTVKDAPNVDVSADEPLTEDEVNRLYQHYGRSWDDSYRADQAGVAHARDATDTDTTDTDTTDADTSASSAAGSGSDTSAATGDDAMTRSEERLKVGTEREQVGKARLRKYVVTEQEQVTVPVQREEVRLEREPVTAANRDAAYSGPELTGSEHEVTVSGERPVVEKETVPVERVRLDTETVTEQQPVEGEVRKQRIEAELPDEGRRNVD